MKRIILLFTLFACVTTWSVAQEEELERDPKAQQKIRAARIAFITERLGLTPEEAEKFWPIYNEFSQKRSELKQQLAETKRNQNQSRPQEERERELLELGLKLRQQELDLEKEYSGRILNVINAQKMMALRRAETDFRDMVIRQLQRRQMQQERREDFKERNEQRLRQRNN